MSGLVLGVTLAIIVVAYIAVVLIAKSKNKAVKKECKCSEDITLKSMKKDDGEPDGPDL